MQAAKTVSLYTYQAIPGSDKPNKAARTVWHRTGRTQITEPGWSVSRDFYFLPRSHPTSTVGLLFSIDRSPTNTHLSTTESIQVQQPIKKLTSRP